LQDKIFEEINHLWSFPGLMNWNVRKKFHAFAIDNAKPLVLQPAYYRPDGKVAVLNKVGIVLAMLLSSRISTCRSLG